MITVTQGQGQMFPLPVQLWRELRQVFGATLINGPRNPKEGDFLISQLDNVSCDLLSKTMLLHALEAIAAAMLNKGYGSYSLELSSQDSVYLIALSPPFLRGNQAEWYIRPEAFCIRFIPAT